MKIKNHGRNGIWLVILIIVIVLIMLSLMISKDRKSIGGYFGLSSQTCRDGKKIVWSDEKNGNIDVFMCEICEEFNNCNTFNEKYRLTFSRYRQLNPVINNNVIVWQETDDEGYIDLFMCDLDRISEYSECEESKRQITANKEMNTNPSIFRNKIIWRSDTGIYLCSLDLKIGQAGSCYAKDEKIKLVNGENVYDPVIEGDWISWLEQNELDKTLYKIHFCRLSDLSLGVCYDNLHFEQEFFRIDYKPNVDNGIVVFDYGKIGEKSIFYTNGRETNLVIRDLDLYGSPQIYYPYIIFKLAPHSLGPVCICSIEKNGQDYGCLVNDKKYCTLRRKYSQHYPVLFSDSIIIKNLDDFNDIVLLADFESLTKKID